MNSTVISILIGAAAFILSVLSQIWLRANAEGVDKQSLLTLSGNVAKLIAWNDDRISFQAMVTEFIKTHTKLYDKLEERVNKVENRQSEMQGREDGRSHRDR